MKATCPSCQRSYRVADEKVPDTGAQIKCPKCGTLFVVRRPQPPSTPPPQAPQPEEAPRMRIPLKHEQATPLQALTGQEVPDKPAPGEGPAPPASTTPDLDRLEGEEEISSPADAAAAPPARPRGMSAIRAQSAAKPGPAPGSDLLGSWRVRTPRGLTYDFAGPEALDKWLAEREDCSGCQVAPPDADWIPAEQYLARQPSGTARPEPGEPPARPADQSPAAPAPGVPPGEPLRPAVKIGGLVPPRAQPVPRRPAGPLAWVLGVAAVLTTVAVLLVAAATLTRYGLVDCSAVLPLDAVGIVYPAAQTDTATRQAPEAAAQRDPETVFRKALRQARRALRAKRFSKAALEYKRALGVHPGSVEALEGIAKAYNGLGDRARALNALDKARSIKSR